MEIEARTGYELLLSLVAFDDARADDEGTLSEASEWLAAVREAASRGLLAELAAFSAGSAWAWGNLVPLVVAAPEPRDGRALVGWLRSLDPIEIRRHLLGHYLRPFRRETPPDISRRAADGDPAAAGALQATSFPQDARWQAALRTLLPLTATETKERLVGLLERWLGTVFEAHEARLRPLLERDAESKRALARVAPVERLIETATNGWDYIAEPGVERILLVPSVLIRPWVLTADHGDLRIFCYPVADEVLTPPDEPPARLVRQLRALGDVKRLRMLRRLSEGPASLHKLSTEFAMPKTTLLHHLVLLRSAGLVRLHDTSDRQYSPHAAGYHLRAEVVTDVYAALLAYLRQSRPGLDA